VLLYIFQARVISSNTISETFLSLTLIRTTGDTISAGSMAVIENQEPLVSLESSDRMVDRDNILDVDEQLSSLGQKDWVS
jgi:hypothetical protein